MRIVRLYTILDTRLFLRTKSFSTSWLMLAVQTFMLSYHFLLLLDGCDYYQKNFLTWDLLEFNLTFQGFNQEEMSSVIRCN